MKVVIDAGGRRVEFECADDVPISIQDFLVRVLAVWRETDGAVKPSTGPAFGLASGERRPESAPPRLGRGQVLPVVGEGS